MLLLFYQIEVIDILVKIYTYNRLIKKLNENLCKIIYTNNVHCNPPVFTGLWGGFLREVVDAGMLFLLFKEADSICLFLVIKFFYE